MTVRLAGLHSIVAGPDGIPLDLRDVLAGQLVVVRGGLRFLEVFEALLELSMAAVADVVGTDEAHALGADGLHRLHREVTPIQLIAVRTYLETSLRPPCAALLARFADALVPQASQVYLGNHLGVRVMPPRSTFDRLDSRAPDFDPGYYAGFMVPRDAHVDSWFNTAVNSVNLWAAVGPVRRGNGLLFWPEAYRRPLRHDGWTLCAGQSIGEPVGIELDAGDVLVFAGDHLHATRPNDTAETRYVITKRLCLGAPRYSLSATGWVPYLDPRLLDTPLEPLAGLRSRLTLGGVRDLLRSARERVIRP